MTVLTIRLQLGTARHQLHDLPIRVPAMGEQGPPCLTRLGGLVVGATACILEMACEYEE